MIDSLLSLFYTLGLILVSGFHASELLVTLFVAAAFLTMAVLGREREEADAASLDYVGHDWLPRSR